MDYGQWHEPKLLVKILLNFVRHHPNEIELLFQLLRPLTSRFIPDFQVFNISYDKDSDIVLKGTFTANYLFRIPWGAVTFKKFMLLLY